jgi:hypothetical protein
MSLFQSEAYILRTTLTSILIYFIYCTCICFCKISHITHCQLFFLSKILLKTRVLLKGLAKHGVHNKIMTYLYLNIIIRFNVGKHIFLHCVEVHVRSRQWMGEHIGITIFYLHDLVYCKE